MDRDAQIKMLRQMRFTLLEQQEQLKQTLAELADQANQLARLLEYLVPTHVSQEIVLPSPSLYYRDGLNPEPEDEGEADEEDEGEAEVGQDDGLPASPVIDIEPVVSDGLAAGPVLVLPVVEVVASVTPATPDTPATPVSELTKPGKVYKSLKAPVKGEQFAWNGEDYIIVTVVSITGMTGNFRAKRSSQIKKPGKPFDFRWEKSLGFTVQAN